MEALQWVGCYEHAGAQLHDFHNTLPRPEGFTSTACARACQGFRYIFLLADGRCSCSAVRPRVPDFHEVDERRCGEPCASEEALLPRRRCGGDAAFAIFGVLSVAEVREELESQRAAGHALSRTDIWPSWPPHRRDDASGGGAGAAVAALHEKPVLKGISYGPVPLREHGRLPDDDFMSESAQALWGAAGRRDLAVIRALGANVVRLYGNDPALDHTLFLDEAMKNGLEVIAGISDYPYTQMPGNCISTNFDCYGQVFEQYSQNLKRGFLTVGNAYHPALRTVILMNEADLKFQGGPPSFCKALVSAFDAALDAEKELGVAGAAPAFTATFSFGVCAGCSRFGQKPAIGQMLELRNAMKDPMSVGYSPRNDLWAAYQARFVNSFNTANPATDIRWMFLNIYDTEFPRMPVFIGEYHSPRNVDQKRDLETILKIARNTSTMLQGIAFFEFQVRYDKGGSEMSFGMFGLEERIISDVLLGDEAFSVYCLKPLEVADVIGHIWNTECGPMEVGVDYMTESTWALSIDHSPSPDSCCYQCTENPMCRSWTWVEDAGLESPGQPSQCWLKGGEPTGKVPKDGVISGMPKAFAATVEFFIDDVSSRLSWDDVVPPMVLKDGQRQLRYGQCGGKFWRGPTLCPVEYRCAHRSEFYSQCAPEGHEDYVAPGITEAKLPNIFVHQAVTDAFGGTGVTAYDLCPIATTVTTTSRTTALAAEPEWKGCYMQGPGASYVYSNEQGGYTSDSCAWACRGYKYALLHNAGHCSCASSEPEESEFSLVSDSWCGQACVGEEELLPARYCGALTTFAIYKMPRSANPSSDKVPDSLEHG